MRHRFNRIAAAFPIFCSGEAISHLAVHMCRGFIAAGMPAQLVVPTVSPSVTDDFIVSAVAPAWNPVIFRVDRCLGLLDSRYHRHILRHTDEQTLLWAFPAVPLEVRREAQARGALVAAECTNCHTRTTRAIIAEAYRRLGWPATFNFSEADIRSEEAKLSEADVIFAQSPCVAESLMENGISGDKIIGSSVGWSPDRFPEAPAREECRRPGFLFAGSIGVRKGVHLLLDAWRDAAIEGDLTLAGQISNDFQVHGAERFHQPGVKCPGFLGAIGRIMADNDIFVLPTLEEGGPMVTYEAAAMGMAIVTTPMGAGALLRHNVDGLILEPYDHDSWVQTLRRLAKDTDLRRRLGAAARARAMEFTWDKVAARRLASLTALLPTNKSTEHALVSA